MWMFGSRTTVKKVRNSLTWFSQGREIGSFTTPATYWWTFVHFGLLAFALMESSRVLVWCGQTLMQNMMVAAPSLKGAVQPYAMLCGVDDELHFFDTAYCVCGQ